MDHDIKSNLSAAKVPVVYSDAYNIKFYGIEKLHPFPFDKNKQVLEDLMQRGFFNADQIACPGKPISDEDMESIHTRFYLRERLNSSLAMAEIFELKTLSVIPAAQIRKHLIEPLKYQAQGTVMAGQLATKFGWAINLGGGFHHAHRERGEGFCPIADITLSINKLRASNPDIEKIMIVDLDAHQGNGHERDFLFDPNIFTMDFYSRVNYPEDVTAMRKIDIKEEFEADANDEDYLGRLAAAFNKLSGSYEPDAIYYVAGTDIMKGDPEGRLSMTPGCVIKRDEMVFDFAFKNKAPVVMLFGGGYQKNNAKVIADSIANLNDKFGLFRPA